MSIGMRCRRSKWRNTLRREKNSFWTIVTDALMKDWRRRGRMAV